MEIDSQSQRDLKQFHVAEQLRLVDRLNFLWRPLLRRTEETEATEKITPLSQLPHVPSIPGQKLHVPLGRIRNMRWTLRLPFFIA